MVKIKAKVYWARWMNELNTQYNADNEKYECTLGDISEEDAAKLTAMGIKMKQKNFASNVIVCKSKFPFIAALPQGEVKPTDIGNGTEVECVVSFYTHKMSKMHGNAPSLVAKKGEPSLHITKLVTYVPETTADEADIPF
jgi:hypothetical protein